MCRDVSEIDEILFSQSEYSVDDVDALEDPNLATLTLTGAEKSTAASSAWPSWPERRMSSNVPESFWMEFPPKSFCDTALKWYFRGYHPLVPLVHVPSFRKEYGNFWGSFEARRQNRASLISFATLLLSFLYAGVFVSDEEPPLILPGLEAGETLVQLNRLTTRAMKLAKFPYSPTLDTLRAYMVQQAVRMREEEPLTTIAFVGLSLRVANMLGLHKDPRHFPQIGKIEGEVRRRTWWQLVHIDVCLAVAAGLPPLIDLQSWDVQPMSELKDDLIGTAEGMQYEEDVREGRRPAHLADNPCDISTTSMVSTSNILAASKYRFTRMYQNESAIADPVIAEVSRSSPTKIRSAIRYGKSGQFSTGYPAQTRRTG